MMKKWSLIILIVLCSPSIVALSAEFFLDTFEDGKIGGWTNRGESIDITSKITHAGSKFALEQVSPPVSTGMHNWLFFMKDVSLTVDAGTYLRVSYYSRSFADISYVTVGVMDKEKEYYSFSKKPVTKDKWLTVDINLLKLRSNKKGFLKFGTEISKVQIIQRKANTEEPTIHTFVIDDTHLYKGKELEVSPARIEFMGVNLTNAAGSTLLVPYKAPLKINSADDKITLPVQLASQTLNKTTFLLEYEVLDYYFRVADKGQQKIALNPKQTLRYEIPLSQEAVSRLYKKGVETEARKFLVNIVLRDLKGKKLHETGRQVFNVSFPKRVFSILPPLTETVYEEIPLFGKLRLVDVVNCYDDQDPHSYMEGGKSYDGTYSSEPLPPSPQITFETRGLWGDIWRQTYREIREKFTKTETILGKKCRTADNWAWFAYRSLGRGQIKKNHFYLVVVEYPEDEGRTFTIDIRGGELNPIGFHTGKTIGDESPRQRFVERGNYPLSQKWEKWYSLNFSGNINSDFWFYVFSPGDSIAPFSKGVAIRNIKVYEIENLPKYFLQVNEPPQDLPQRGLYVIWEDFLDRTSPEGVVQRLKFLGYNGLFPPALPLGRTASWPSKVWVSEKPNSYAKDNPQFFGMRSPEQYEMYLKSAKKYGLKIAPLLDYVYGSPELAEEALLDKPPVPDIAHPATLEDINKIIDETVGKYYQKYPNLIGVYLARMGGAGKRCFSDYDIRLFEKDTGINIPQGSTKEKADWILRNAEEKYNHWWLKKKHDFLDNVLAKLQSYRPEMKLFFINWRMDTTLPFCEIPMYMGHPEDNKLVLIPARDPIPDFSKMSMKDLITNPRYTSDKEGINPRLYDKDKNILYLCPVRYKYTANNKEYLDFFKTGAGLNMVHPYPYNEALICWNYSGIAGGMQMEHSGSYSRMESVFAMANADPFNIINRAYMIPKSGFPYYARKFAAAYRSLPAIPSEVLQDSLVKKDPDVVVRSYRTGYGEYLGIVNKSHFEKSVRLRLVRRTQDIKYIKDLVSNEKINFQKIDQNKIELLLKMKPVELRSLLIVPYKFTGYAFGYVEVKTEIISPNGDGINDEIVLNGHLVEAAKDSGWTVDIKNENAKLVRQFKGSNWKMRITWDGKGKNGEIVSDGVYTYFFKGERGNPRSGKFIVDTTPPSIPKIILPKDNTVVKKRVINLIINGEPKTKVELFLNEISGGVFSLDSKGRYKDQVGLKAGENGIKARSLDKAGNISPYSKVVAVTYKYKPSVFRFDVGAGPVEEGYKKVDVTSYSPLLGYGWDHVEGLGGRDRVQADNLRRDYNGSGSNNTFKIDIPEGEYEVTLVMGDAIYSHSAANIYAEGKIKVIAQAIGKGQFIEKKFKVTVTDGQLTLEFKKGEGYPGWLINGIIVRDCRLAE